MQRLESELLLLPEQGSEYNGRDKGSCHVVLGTVKVSPSVTLLLVRYGVCGFGSASAFEHRPFPPAC